MKLLSVCQHIRVSQQFRCDGTLKYRCPLEEKLCGSRFFGCFGCLFFCLFVCFLFVFLTVFAFLWKNRFSCQLYFIGSKTFVHSLSLSPTVRFVLPCHSTSLFVFL